MSNYSIKQNRVKNPNWPANQLAIYKRYRGFELGHCCFQDKKQFFKFLKIMVILFFAE